MPRAEASPRLVTTISNLREAADGDLLGADAANVDNQLRLGGAVACFGGGP